jgi:hypothetical protein
MAANHPKRSFRCQARRCSVISLKSPGAASTVHQPQHHNLRVTGHRPKCTGALVMVTGGGASGSPAPCPSGLILKTVYTTAWTRARGPLAANAYRERLRWTTVATIQQLTGSGDGGRRINAVEDLCKADDAACGVLAERGKELSRRGGAIEHAKCCAGLAGRCKQGAIRSERNLLWMDALGPASPA